VLVTILDYCVRPGRTVGPTSVGESNEQRDSVTNDLTGTSHCVYNVRNNP
jgi:hypothetical protein